MARGFARIFEKVITSKGIGFIIQGSQNTFIENRLAARIGDKVLLPRGIGAVATGSGTVFINTRRAARKFDRVIPPGVVISSASKTKTA
jgi:uncharacterized Zn-binding protein involved in type VI secretion